MTRRALLKCVLVFLACPLCALAAGPADRVATEPMSITSLNQAQAKAVAVADVISTARLSDATVSVDGAHIVYSGDASGRLNLWMMPSAGGEASQLTHSNEHQLGPVFTHDGREVVYMQDTGGDELRRQRAAQYYAHAAKQREQPDFFPRRLASCV